LNATTIGTLPGLLKKYLKTSQFATENGFKIEIKIVTVHTGIWRFVPDFAFQVSDEVLELGRMHLALQLGTRIIDWSDSSLVMIRSIESCQAVILDELYSEIVYEGPSGEQVNNIITELGKVILDWSIHKTYKKDKVDSFQFIEAVLKQLKSKIVLPDQLVKFFKDMGSRKGPSKPYKCPYTSKKHTFKTHTELDDYVLETKEKHPNFEAEQRESWAILQCYDRHFWCGITTIENDKWPANDKPSASGCPFLKPLFEKYFEGGISSRKASKLIKKKLDK